MLNKSVEDLTGLVQSRLVNQSHSGAPVLHYANPPTYPSLPTQLAPIRVLHFDNVPATLPQFTSYSQVQNTQKTIHWPMETDMSGFILPQTPSSGNNYQRNEPPTLPLFDSSSGERGKGTKRTRREEESGAERGKDSKARKDHSSRKEHPALPGFKPPPHPISQYGIIPSTAPSSDDEDALPSSTLTVPFEALLSAAAASTENSGVPGATTPLMREKLRKRRRRFPPPPNAFPVSCTIIPVDYCWSYTQDEQPLCLGCSRERTCQ